LFSDSDLDQRDIWEALKNWAEPHPIPPPVTVKIGAGNSRKHPHIPVLDNYEDDAPPGFWQHFPSNPLPDGPKTAVRADRLRMLIKRFGGDWSYSKRRVAARALKNLTKGARPQMSRNLPGLEAANAKSALNYGAEITDTIADWVSKGFVAGPFEQPPMENFRCNPIMAVIQPAKIRPVLNMSAPAGQSYNEAINEAQLPKLNMSTARDFSYSAAAAGKGAKMSKLDLKDAYKNIPCHPALWPSQGFKWLGRYFIDLTTVFGSKAAPADFDCLGATIGELARTISRLPAEEYHRTLDDTTIVCKEGKTGRRFVQAYRRICKFINIQLADEDDEKEKAFSNSTVGTVLGIQFNTEQGTWSLPERRRTTCCQLISLIHFAPGVHLQQIQQLIGNLEAFGQLAPFSKALRWNLLAFLRDFNGDPEKILPVPESVKKDLQVWYQIIQENRKGFKIQTKPTAPPMCCLEFVSDAAGRPPQNSKDRNGAASLGLHDGYVWFGTKIRWPVQFTWAADSRSAVFELLGLILPFCLIPERLKGKSVMLKVDNQAIIWSWAKRQMKQDPLASVLIRTLHILETALKCRIYIEHLPRMSTPAAAAADRLSRDSTETPEDVALLSHPIPSLPKALLSWMKNANMDWNLGYKIASEINI